MKNIKLLSLLLLGSIAVSPLQAAGQKRQAPGSDERTAKRLRTEAPEHKVADGWDGFVDADDQVLLDAHEDSSFNDTDEKRVVANRVAPAQQAAADQAEAGSLNPCTNCQYQNDATATECGVCAYKPGEVLEQQVVQNHPKDKMVKASNTKRQKLDEGAQAPTPSHAHTFTFEAFFPNGGGCEDIFWIHGYELFHIDDVYNLVKTNKKIHSTFFKTVLANYPQIRQVLLTGDDINQIDENKETFVHRAIRDKNLLLLHLLAINGAALWINYDDSEKLNQAYEAKPLIKKFIKACQNLHFIKNRHDDTRCVNEAQEAITQGAYVNCKYNADGWTPLHKACFAQQIALVNFLLTIPSIDANAISDNGNTALMMACPFFNPDHRIVALFLAFPGINIDIRGSDGKTAFESLEFLPRTNCTIKLFEEFQARREFQTLENFALTLPHQLFGIHGIVLIVGEFLGAREPRVEVVQDQEDGK